ncbi:thioredoxin-disulfide reductase [Lichenihabitans sp. Uapishka_5]|uniref:thioredoxin-disulfide reductase n=1 Tax=Lichenihabitans sp. Uapishka_5 TaxID=3037302 RepID=UPI0029E8176F|nr:thioredoxin-disulfide reductase [Lichenihabitans sp. Uapishka_5]MDX7951962.1 thioredoxin-disulfide reductase [Lichenihabitans sp. Uapishka_5]
MPQTHRTRALIIGAGPAGYTAAVYAARANLEPIVVQGLQPGGQLTITSDVENWPGETSILGPDLMEKMRAQAEHAGARMIFDIIVDVDFSKRPFTCRSDGGDTFIADTVIIATGAQAKWLGLPSEQMFMGAGVSGCAVCDGAFFRNKHVVVVGGGNTAVEDALYLTRHASKVTVVHRRDRFRAEKILQERLLNNPKVEVVWNHRVAEITGGGTPRKVTGIRLQHTGTDAVTTLDTDGVFVAIGHAPATAVFQGHLPTDADGYLLTAADSTATAIPGVFAAGDVKDKIYRQAVTAAGMGCMAALEAEKFLAEHDADPKVRDREVRHEDMIGAYD